MTRLASLGVVAFALGAFGSAPVQCKRDPDPNVRLEDTAGDALWDLAEDFKKKGNTTGARDTLRFLVERYPSSRHAAAARAELGGDVPSADVDAGR